MSFNIDELVAPAWLSNDFFCGVMRKADNDPTIELTEPVVLRPGTKLGDHYASVMFRTTVKYRSKRIDGEQSIDLIMKTKPEAEGLKKELLEDDTLFEIEIRMYSKILPEVARLMKEIGEVYKFPRYLYGALVPHCIVLLEDVSYQGWVMGDFIETVDDMRPIVKDIAMLHAASAVIESRDPNFAAENNISILEKLLSFDLMIQKGFSDLMHLTKVYPEFVQFAKPLQNFQRKLPEILGSVYTPSATIPNVLTHGDFQSKNILHLIDAQGRHKDTLLLDYQACCWTTPAIDLYSLLDMIASQQLKNSSRGELIYLYHRQFSDLLKRLNFSGKIPTMLDLQMELLRCAGLEMFHIVVFTSYQFLSRVNIDLEAYIKGELDNPALNSPEFRTLMYTELSRLLHQGTLSDE